jgi:hypothetical protein
MSTGQMPQRSHRVIGALVEFSVSELERRSKKKIAYYGDNW